ncbi:MAG: phosphoribosylglycinamide formyltransferase [Gemmatimonadota bacterium]|nr:phosphoribosylglycinamide formyltransferase [Gemmatimonadota bacterium]
MTSRIAVLASGRGSNLEALLDYLAPRASNAMVTLVASDKSGSSALALAQVRDIETSSLEMGARYEASLSDLLENHAVDLIVLAGYLKLVPSSVIHSFRGRMLNVHPALLPAFGGEGMYGARIHRAVLASGARVSGATVHFVDEIYDHGAIIAQWPVPVYGDDTETTLATRVLRAEHALLPRVVDRVASGRIKLGVDNRVSGVMDIVAPRDAFAPVSGEDLDVAIEAALALADS